MIICSMDIETTGLNEETCQIIEIGAVIEDTNNQKPIDQLPYFHTYVLHEIYQGEPYALAMHQKIFERIAKQEKPYQYLSSSEAVVELSFFLKENLPNEKKYIIVGKNFASFDLKFFRANEFFKPLTYSFRHRIIDVGSMFINWYKDTEVPDTSKCLERMDMNPKITHDALGDAKQVIALLRNFINPIKDFEKHHDL